MDAGRFAGIFAERPTEWISVLNPGAGNQRFYSSACACVHVHSACVHVHMYMHTYALCGYTCHLRTCRYAAIHVNRPSGISQAAAIAANHAQGVKGTFGSGFLTTLDFLQVKDWWYIHVHVGSKQRYTVLQALMFYTHVAILQTLTTPNPPKFFSWFDWFWWIQSGLHNIAQRIEHVAMCTKFIKLHRAAFVGFRTVYTQAMEALHNLLLYQFH